MSELLVERPGDGVAVLTLNRPEKRKLFTGDSPARILAMGAIPGRAYEPPEFSVLGTPDPVAGQAPPTR